jgi:uncharacterized phage protein (TIGR02218 family)
MSRATRGTPDVPHSRSKPIESLTVYGTSRLVRCWTLVLNNGRGTIRLTEHDAPLMIGGVVYDPTDAVSASAILHEGQLRTPNENIRGILSSSKIKEEYLRDGSVQGSEITEFCVDWRFPFAGTFRVMRYTVARVSWNDAARAFEADIVGMADRLSNRVGELYSRRCNATLGDSRCGIVLSGYQKTGTVSSATNRAVFAASLSGGEQEPGWFDDGRISFTVGDNASLSFTVKSYDGAGGWELQLPTPYAIAASDQFTVTPGCNKLAGIDIDGELDGLGDCINKYDNISNFRGFPTIPTNDKLYQTPNAKRSED